MQKEGQGRRECSGRDREARTGGGGGGNSRE